MFKFGACVLFVVIFLVGDTGQKRIPSFAGPYRAKINRITNVSDEFQSNGKIYVKVFTSPFKQRESQYYWGIANIGSAITDDMAVRMSVRNNNQWKRNAFVMKFDSACSDLMKHARTIIEFAWRPSEWKCPLSAYGFRKVENKTWDFHFPNFPIMPYNRYLFSLAILDSAKVVVGVIVADAEAVPKI